MLTLVQPEPSPRPHEPRDIRHFVVCSYPIRPHQSAAYLAARTLVALESLTGDDARIVLVTARPRETAELPLDVSVDVLPMFTGPASGRGWRVNRDVFAYLFKSARPNTVFHIHDSRHPILIPIVQGMRALGIEYRGSRFPGSCRS